MAGDAFAPRLPAVHPFAAFRVLVGDEHGLRVEQHVLGDGEPVVGAEEDGAAVLIYLI